MRMRQQAIDYPAPEIMPGFAIEVEVRVSLTGENEVLGHLVTWPHWLPGLQYKDSSAGIFSFSLPRR
jgi:hypothetical protein